MGSDAVIEVELSGARAGNGADGLVVRAAQSMVTGLAINGFAGDGIEISSRANKIVGNHIGTDPTGELDRGNGAAGVRIRSGSLNKIGEGTSHSNRNVISGNGNGVGISGSGSPDNRVLNSYVGLDADGTEDVGNSGDGVVVDGARSTDVSTGITSRINIISGNDGNGVKVVGGTETRVANNRIGTDATGKVDVGNGLNGVRVVNSPNNLIGDGEQPCGSCWGGKPLFGAGNVVSGNGESGVQLEGTATRGNRVLNSQIGTDPSRTRALGNDRHGVAIVSGARDNFVGGVRREEWETNEIAFNGASGAMVASGATGNAVFSNSTFANRGSRSTSTPTA